MRATRLEIGKLTPIIGAEVLGIDLANALDDADLAALKDALRDHLVIFFRDQDITAEQHKAFGRHFGELVVHPAAKAEVPDHPEIRVVAADEKSTWVAGELWHSDMSCQPEPPMGSILHIKTVPPDGGGDTAFTNMYAAYDALSKPMRTMLEGLKAVHDSGEVYAGDMYKRSDKTAPRAEHPVVRTHPATRRKCLFVNPVFTTRIVDLPKPESDAILEFLHRHCEAFEYQCRFKWRANSIAFWDNRCSMHKAVWDYHPQKRYGHRINIKGERPV